ncbi:M16 family metallopeptidase [Nannocystis exedens]|uniref:M16 family metallopeptidase n=1 Tax=Nannocystis exedens TaxID=54 RepID=UPI0011600EA4|nr:insulinase family protein [Nannocystis exedens]
MPTTAPAVVAPRLERLGPSLLHVRRAGPTTAIGLVLRTGAEVDPPLASFTLELLARGRDRAVEDALGEYGGAIEVVWLADGALLQVEVEASAWREALGLLTAAVRSAALTGEDVEALRRERLAALQRRDGDPAARGLHLLQRRLAPSLDPLGEARRAASWSIEHVRKAQEQWLRAARPALVVVGEAPRAELARAAASALGEWPGPAAARTLAPESDAQEGRLVLPVPRREVLVVPRPGLAQTAILVGRTIPGDADALALELASAVVGSALREVLRRDRGDTYSVAVSHAPARRGGLLAIETQVEAAATGASLRAMFSQLKSAQGRFLTGDLLRLLGRAFQVERMLGQQRLSAVVEGVARLHVAGRPDDALAAELRRLGGVRDDDVESALSKWFAPEAMQVVLVGDPGTIRAQVEPLGLGPLQVIDDAR